MVLLAQLLECDKSFDLCQNVRWNWF